MLNRSRPVALAATLAAGPSSVMKQRIATSGITPETAQPEART
jgi:hypothetical protein